MRQPAQGNSLERFIRSARHMFNKYPRLSLLVGGIWLANTLVCLVLAAVWVVWNLPGAQSTGLSATLTPDPISIAALDQTPAAAAPLDLQPTPDCGPQILTLGETRWRVEGLARAADGSIPVPPDSPDTAFQVQDSGLNDLFTISPTAENQGLVSALQAGMSAIFGSDRCNTTLYTLSAPVPGPLDMAALEDQSAPGLVVFIPESADLVGITLRGEPSKLIFSGDPTPASGVQEVEAEVACLETATASDGATITVSIEVYNYGESAFTLAADDVALIPEGAQALAPVASEPGLPYELQPRQREAITFTFPNPGGVEVVFQVFTVEFNLSDFR